MRIKLLLLSLVLILTGCAKEPTVYEYRDFNQISNWDQVYGLEQGVFYIYIYSEYCIACDGIKQEVLTYFYESQKEEDTPVYLVNYYLVDNEPPFEFTHTPTLVVMEGDSVLSIIDSPESIRSYINPPTP
jgi:hypothetical protein